jgi:outer membrane protein assembly factor BamB
VEEVLLIRLIILGALLGLGLACSGTSSGSGDVGPPWPTPFRFSTCITDWPKGPDAPPALAPPLNVAAPRVLWRNPIGVVLDHGGYNAGLVLSGTNLVAATGTGITIIDKVGNSTELSGWIGHNFDFASSVTTDPAGDMYFTAPSGTYALTADGKAKWAQREGAIPYGEGTSGRPFGTPLALDPNGVLYGASNDGQLRAFRTQDGSVLWRARPALLDPSEARFSFALGGAGSVLFAQAGREGIAAFDARTGSELGRLRYDDGSNVMTFEFRWALGITGTIFAGFSFLDNCGQVKWRNPLLQKNDEGSYDVWGAIIALPERYAACIQAFDSGGFAVPGTNALYYYDPDGNAVVGPKPGNGFPIAVGADGTLYTVSCKYTNPPENRLYAYSPTLDELWRLNLGKNSWCPMGNGVLDSDGVLYFVIPDENKPVTDVIAIQTKSPGLAPSAWPMIRHDNRGTMWLTPLPPLDTPDESTDGGAAGGIDATIDTPLE